MIHGTIDVGGFNINYQRQDVSDRTIVLLHGNSGCKDVFAKQFEFFENSGYSLLAFDLPGHGMSENANDPKINYTMPGYAKIINQALKVLSIKEYVLVGWSLGGNIALEMAGCDLVGANPHFKGMMIFGAPPVGPGMENIEKAYLPATFETAVGDEAAPSAQIDAFVQAIYGTLSPIPKAFYDCAHRTEGQAREIMVSHWMSGVNGHNQYNTIATWEKPICVVHGNEDPFAALDYLKEAPWKNLWGEQIFEFPQCGHAPFIEFPKPFNALLEKFAKDAF